MKKQILLLLVLLPCYGFCQLRKKTNQYYTEYFKVVADTTKCFYFEKPYSDQGVDTAYTYYCSNRSLFSKTVMVAGIPEGSFEKYFKNGVMKEKGVYTKGRQVGDVETWYESGVKRSVRRYSGDFMTPSVLVQYWNSAGEQLIKDGNGDCVCVLNETESDSVVQTGEIRDYKKHSMWTGSHNGKKLFVEEYDNGELVRGTSFDDDGNTYEYTKIDDPAMPKGGLQEMYAFIGANLKYPAKSRRLGHQGTVYISFVVGKDGTLSDFDLIRGISTECDEEALRVVKLFPPWKPGEHRGKIVKAKYTLPVKFKLTR